MKKLRKVVYSLGAIAFLWIAALPVISALQSRSEDAHNFDLSLLDLQNGTNAERTLKLSDPKDNPVVLNS